MVLLDRDGVINELVPRPPDGHGESPLDAREVRLTPGAADQLLRLRRAGFLLACVTNQPSAAKGLASCQEVEEVHARVIELLGGRGVTFDAQRICWHHPDAVVPSLRGPCACRKPEPGMLLEVLDELGAAAQSSFMVGDTDADVIAGRKAGVVTVLIETPASRHKRSASATPTYVTADLSGAVGMIIGEAPGGVPLGGD